MSTQLPMLAQTAMDSYMETLAALVCHCMCVPVTLLLVRHLVRKCNASIHEFMPN